MWLYQTRWCIIQQWAYVTSNIHNNTYYEPSTVDICCMQQQLLKIEELTRCDSIRKIPGQLRVSQSTRSSTTNATTNLHIVLPSPVPDSLQPARLNIQFQTSRKLDHYVRISDKRCQRLLLFNDRLWMMKIFLSAARWEAEFYTNACWHQ